MGDFLDSIGIYVQGTQKGDKYVVDLADSVEYDKILNKLERAESLEEDEDSSVVGYDSASSIFENDKYLITIIADFKNDTYKLTVKEKK